MKFKIRITTIVVPLMLGMVATGVIMTLIGAMDRDGALSLKGLIRELKTGEVPQRRLAASTLSQMIGPDAEIVARSLLGSIGDSDPVVRGRVARGLGQVLKNNAIATNPETIYASMASLLSDTEPDVRASAALGLWTLRREAPGLLEAAIDGLQSDDASLETESLALLSQLPIRTSEEMKRLFGMLDDPAPPLQQAGRRALVRPNASLAADLALPVLRGILEKGSLPAREVAATMLGRSIKHNNLCRDLLISALKDPQVSVRLAAAAAMGAYSEDTIGRFALRLATDDSDLRVRATAAASLAVGRNASKAEALAELKAAVVNDPWRVGLAEDLLRDPEHATPQLLSALRDPNVVVRAAAAKCLGEVAHPPTYIKASIEGLTKALADREASVRRSAAAALGRFGPEAAAAAEALRWAVRDSDRSVSGQALISLRSVETSKIK